MSVEQFNSVLVRLYIDRYFRELFFESPDALLSDYELSPSEAASLTALDKPSVSRFAKGLREKLKGTVQDVFNVPSALFPIEFDRLFDIAYDNLKLGARESLIDYSIRVGEFIEGFLHELNLPDYCKDFVRFETVKLKAKQKNMPTYIIESSPCSVVSKPKLYPHLFLQSFQYDMEDLMKHFKSETLESCQLQPSHYLIASQGGKLKMDKINLATKLLLDYCNGALRVNEIATFLRSNFAVTADQLAETVIPNLIKQRILYIEPSDEH